MITRKIFSYGARNLFFAFAVILALAFTACDNDPTINPGVPPADPHSITYTGYDSKGKAYKLVITKGTDSSGIIIGGGGGDDGNKPGPIGGNTRDSGLINGANDVWADSYPAGQRDGFIFKADDTFHSIDDYTNTTPGVWKIYATGTWKTILPNWLTFTGSGGSIVYRYTVTETTLTLTDMDGDSETFTKTQAAVSGRSVVSPAPEGKAGTKAVTGAIKRTVSADLGSPAARAAAASRAAYAPKSGDEFTLTIKDILSGDTEGTSTGTVTDISSDGDSDTLTLDNDGKEFTVKIKDLFIEEITGPIPLDDGEEWEAPDPLYPYDPNNPDGGDGPTNWIAVTNSPFGDSQINSIAYGDGKFVAVGDYGKMAYSTNGINWIAVANNPFGDYSINSIVYGNGRWVAGGYSFEFSLAYSDDGVNWTPVADRHGSIIGGVLSLAYGGGRFVAGSSNGQMAYSTNGSSWTAVADRTVWEYTNSDGEINIYPAHIYGIAYGNNRFVAVGDYGKMAYSANGSSWTAVTDRAVWQYGDGLHEYRGIMGIAYGNNRFVAVGNSNKMAYSTTNGTSWTAVTNNPFVFADIYGFPVVIWSIAYGNGRFVAGGEFGKMAYSADGASWTAIANSTFSNDGTVRGIAYGNGRFVAVGDYDDNGRIAYCNW